MPSKLPTIIGSGCVLLLAANYLTIPFLGLYLEDKAPLTSQWLSLEENPENSTGKVLIAHFSKEMRHSSATIWCVASDEMFKKTKTPDFNGFWIKSQNNSHYGPVLLADKKTDGTWIGTTGSIAYTVEKSLTPEQTENFVINATDVCGKAWAVYQKYGNSRYNKDGEDTIIKSWDLRVPYFGDAIYDRLNNKVTALDAYHPTENKFTSVAQRVSAFYEKMAF